MKSINTLPRMGKLFYLASPFSHDDKDVEQQRYDEIVRIGAELTNRGFSLIEPIAMSFVASRRHGLPGGYQFWKDRDRLFISKCDAVIVAMMPGWASSVGVSDEVGYAYELGLSVQYLDPTTMNITGVFGALAHAVQ